MRWQWAQRPGALMQAARIPNRYQRSLVILKVFAVLSSPRWFSQVLLTRLRFLRQAFQLGLSAFEICFRFFQVEKIAAEYEVRLTVRGEDLQVSGIRLLFDPTQYDLAGIPTLRCLDFTLAQKLRRFHFQSPI